MIFPNHDLSSYAASLEAARALGVDTTPERLLPSLLEGVIHDCDAIGLAEWEYKHYVVAAFVDPTSAKPITLLAYEAEPSGSVKYPSSRYRLDAMEVQSGYAKLRFLLANDLISLECV